MTYENRSRNELIDIINRRNETIEILEAQLKDAKELIDCSSAGAISEIIEDFKKIRNRYIEESDRLKNIRAELLDMLT